MTRLWKERPGCIYLQTAFSMNNTVVLACLMLAGACSSRKADEMGNTGQDPATTVPAATEVASAPLQAKRTLETPPIPADVDPTEPIADPSPVINRKIVRNATLEFKVTDFRASAKHINALVESFGGMISAEEESRENNALRSQMTIRVPAARFDRFLDTLLHESVYTATKHITAEDVTKQFVDTEARIRNQKATETRYRELLKQARNVKDVLEVEEQLRTIREEVEIQEAELRELKNNVALSTISLTFYQDTEAASAPESPYLSRIWGNLKGGFGLIGGFFLGLAYLLPILAVLGSIGWAVSRWLRQRRRRV